MDLDFQQVNRFFLEVNRLFWLAPGWFSRKEDPVSFAVGCSSWAENPLSLVANLLSWADCWFLRGQGWFSLAAEGIHPHLILSSWGFFFEDGARAISSFLKIKNEWRVIEMRQIVTHRCR